MDEDDFDKELTVAEQVEVLMDDLPKPVQKFLRSKQRDQISLQLSQKYNLHTDTAGVFERCYIYMLLGVYTPDEFVQELRKGGFAEEVIKGIATDVNELVFKKLREEERGGTVSSSPTYRTPPPPTIPVMSVGSSTPSYASGNTTPQDSMPTPTHSISPAPVAVIPPNTAPTAVYHPHPRTMAEDMALASHGMMGQPASPAVSFQTASVPVTYAQPVPAPTASLPPHPYTPPAPVPSAPPVMAPIRLTPVDSDHAAAPIRKEFGSDPYREPIEI